MMNNIEMKIPSKTDYIGVIRLTLAVIANRMGYTYKEIEDIKITISETFIDAVQYAYPEDEVGQLTFGFRTYEDKLEVMVVDSGKSFNFIQIKNELGPYIIKYSGRIVEGGLGLYLLETLMDKVRVWDHFPE